MSELRIKRILAAPSPLSARDVSFRLADIARVSGTKQKCEVFAALLSCDRAEYSGWIVRHVLGELRIGVGAGVVVDALARTFMRT